MKFNFKIQRYQTDAVEAVVNIFKGQGLHERVGYIRDMGTLEDSDKQLSFLAEDTAEDDELIDLENSMGYKNESVQLTDTELLKNIHEMQTANNIRLSPNLIKELGRCSLLYDRPSKATIEYFVGKTVMNGETSVVIDNKQAKAIYKYLLKNDYIDDEDNVTDEYRNDLANNSLVAVPEELKIIEAGIHKLVQGVFDESVLKDMISDGNKPAYKDNPLNDNFYKKEFQELWKAINHKYAYTVDFDSSELLIYQLTLEFSK